MGNFTVDWMSVNTDRWRKLLRAYDGQAFDYLEIGSYEGRSAVFIAENFSKAKITCIDNWKVDGTKERFLENLAPYRDRITPIEGRSTRSLDELAELGARFDVIYIDGAHDRDTVFTDTVQAWLLL